MYTTADFYKALSKNCQSVVDWKYWINSLDHEQKLVKKIYGNPVIERQDFDARWQFEDGSQLEMNMGEVSAC